MLFEWCNLALMAVVALVCLAPLTHVLFASLSTPQGLAAHQGLFLYPAGFTFRGYELVMKNNNILTGYRNTLIYVAGGTCLTLVLNTLGGYVLSRKNVLWNKVIMFLVTFTMLFSGGLIPFYILIKNLGLINRIWSIIIPGSVGVWYIIIIRTYFQGIPYSLEESARVDGANDITILVRIMLPLSKPVLAVIALFSAVGQWNSWFSALIFLRDRMLFPLQLFLREILIINDTSTMITQGMVNYDEMEMYKPLVKYATIVVATLPVLAVYPFLQKYFVKGVMIGSLKG